MLDRTDIFNPNNWSNEDWEGRIYGDDRGVNCAILDQIDYWWAVKWRWRIKPSRGSRKWYFYRTGFLEPGKRTSLYLHVEVMKRTGIERPSELHTIVDHRDGDSFNCRRSNLRWATPAMNRRNIFGAYPHDLVEG